MSKASKKLSKMSKKELMDVMNEAQRYLKKASQKHSGATTVAQLIAKCYHAGDHILTADGSDIDVKAVTDAAISSVAGSRFASMPDGMEISVDPTDKMQITADTTSVANLYIEKYLGLNNAYVPTVVIPLGAHNGSIDDIMSGSSATLTKLARRSNLPIILPKLGEKWNALLKASKKMTNILYIPGVLALGSNESGEKIAFNNTFNILIVVAPKGYKSGKDLGTDEYPEKMMDKSPTFDYILKIMETSVRLRCTNLVIDPFDETICDIAEFEDGVSPFSVTKFVATTWKLVLDKSKYKQNIDTFSAAIRNDGLRELFLNTIMKK